VLRVLLVEDDEATGRVLAAILRAEGIAVHLIDDAEIALELVRLLPLDLVIADFALPGMSGLDLCRVLRGAGQTHPTILISGGAPDELATVAAEVDPRSGVPLVNQWLPKPIDRATLLQTIEEVLTRRSSLPP
jgi:two-component system response regulator MprA